MYYREEVQVRKTDQKEDRLKERSIMKIHTDMRAIVASMVLLFGVSVAEGAQIWLSTTKTPTAITNPTLTLDIGETDFFYLWGKVGAGETISGLGLAITNRTLGVASGTITPATEWENPMITSGFSTRPRWNTSSASVPVSGQAVSFSAGQLITGMNSVGIGAGASPAWGLVPALGADPTYDATTGSYLLGRIDVTGLAAGTTLVDLAVGSATISGTLSPADTILFGAGDTGVTASVVGNTGTVADATIVVVPEPVSGVVFGCLAIGLGMVRRRG